jgi:hypothetical protein
MKSHFKLSAISLIASLSLAACGAPSSNFPSSPAQAPAFDNILRDQTGGASAPTEAPKSEAPVQPASADNPQIARRMIVRNANLVLIVKNTQEQLDEINRIAAEYKGYVVSQNTSKFDKDLRANVVLRVESNLLDSALARLRKLAVEVRSESMSGDDVTAEFVDLDSQLKNLEAAEAQLKKIMEQATRSEDVLNIFNRLTEMRGQIDQIKGRMKYLTQSSALATITLELIPDAASQPVEAPAWRPAGIAIKAAEALIGALQGLVSIMIWFVIFVLPILLIFALPIFAIIWLIRRATRKTKSSGVNATEAK